MRFALLPVLVVSLVGLTSAPAQADWPNWGCTKLARWTGYGFSDGYHHGHGRGAASHWGSAAACPSCSPSSGWISRPANCGAVRMPAVPPAPRFGDRGDTVAASARWHPDAAAAALHRPARVADTAGDPVPVIAAAVWTPDRPPVMAAPRCSGTHRMPCSLRLPHG